MRLIPRLQLLVVEYPEQAQSPYPPLANQCHDYQKIMLNHKPGHIGYCRAPDRDE